MKKNREKCHLCGLLCDVKIDIHSFDGYYNKCTNPQCRVDRNSTGGRLYQEQRLNKESVKLGDTLYTANYLVEYELDQVESIHTTREGAEKAIRALAAKDIRSGISLENTYNETLYIEKTDCVWYIDTMKLEK